MNGYRTECNGDAVFILLPVDLWKKIGNDCNCPTCVSEGRSVAYWDTVAVSTKPGRNHTWMVHHPDLHSSLSRDQAIEVHGR